MKNNDLLYFSIQHVLTNPKKFFTPQIDKQKLVFEANNHKMMSYGNLCRDDLAKPVINGSELCWW